MHQLNPVIDCYFRRTRLHNGKFQAAKRYGMLQPLYLPTQWISLCRHESSSCRKPRLSIEHCCFLHWLAIFYRSCLADTSTGRGSAWVRERATRSREPRQLQRLTDHRINLLHVPLKIQQKLMDCNNIKGISAKLLLASTHLTTSFPFSFKLSFCQSLTQWLNINWHYHYPTDDYLKSHYLYYTPEKTR